MWKFVNICPYIIGMECHVTVNSCHENPSPVIGLLAGDPLNKSGLSNCNLPPFGAIPKGELVALFHNW